MDPYAPAVAPPTRPVQDRWRACVVCYLVWLVLFTVVEGAGRKTCQMPMQKWIAATGNPRERSMREWFRDRANECLDRTPWYAYSVGALFTVGLLAPFGVVWVVRRRVIRFAIPQPVFGLKIAAVLYGAVFVASLAVTLGTMEGIRWIYDSFG